MDEQFQSLSPIARAAFKRTFFLLKAFCDQVALSPSVKNIEELKSVLESLPSENLQPFQSYILVPVSVHLSDHRNHKSSIVCALLECLKVILDKTKVTQINLFIKLFLLTFNQVLDEKEQNKIVSTSSEELKLNVVLCASALIKNTEQEILSEFYSKQHHGKLSMGVYACTRISINEKSIHLRQATLNALMHLTQVHNVNDTTQEYKKQVADVIMLMLPGIISYSLKIATATDIENHKIIVLAIRLWSRVVGLVMEDNLKNDNQTTRVFSLTSKSDINAQDCYIDWRSDQSKTKEKIQKMTRCHNWIERSSKELMNVTKAFSVLKGHQHCKVRLELVQAASHILSCAAKNMHHSVPYLIKVLIILSQDEQPEVKAASMEGIKLFSSMCELNGVKSLVEIVEESMYKLITKLPRIFHGVDLTIKEMKLSLVSGYLDILGSTHVPSLLRSAQHANRLLNSIFIAATLDCSSIPLLEEISLRGIDIDYTTTDVTWKKFKWCSTFKSQKIVEEICKKLIKYSELSWFIHFLLDKFSSDPIHSNEITLIFHYIFSSGSASVDSQISLIIQVFNSLMDQNLWHLQVSVNNDDGITKQEAQSNVVQICSLSETVASLAEFVGRESFSPLLLRCLYPLLECAGNPLYMIANAGLKSVSRIAELYGGGVSDIISNNVDYLSHHVTINLRHAHRNQRVLAVLSVIMKHSTFNALPSIHEILNDVLLQSCDNFREGNANVILQTFSIFIICLKNWRPDDFNLQEEKSNREKNIVDELLDYQKTKLEAEEFDNNDPEVAEITEEEISASQSLTEAKTESVPKHIKLTCQILIRSLHFLPSKEQSRQILVLQILENGVIIIRKWTNELLPIVHKIWSPLVQRFIHCDDHLIMQRAFSLLKTLGKVSKDFIRLRTVREVLPALCNILKRTAKDSLKCEEQAYYMSQKYKLQLCLLQGLGQLSLDLELEERELDAVLEAITPYLSCLQPQTLQDACMDTFKLISMDFPDLLWIHLMSLCPKPLSFQPPSSLFPSYQLEDKTLENSEYRKNVHTLLDII